MVITPKLIFDKKFFHSLYLRPDLLKMEKAKTSEVCRGPRALVISKKSEYPISTTFPKTLKILSVVKIG